MTDENESKQRLAAEIKDPKDEKTALTTEYNYRQIFSATSEAILVLDAQDGTILSVNRSVERMFGYAAIEVIGRSVFDPDIRLPPYDLKNAVGLINKAVNEGNQRFEWLTKRKPQCCKKSVGINRFTREIAYKLRVYSLFLDLT